MALLFSVDRIHKNCVCGAKALECYRPTQARLMRWEKYFSFVTCKKYTFTSKNEMDSETPPQRELPPFTAKCVCVCLYSFTSVSGCLVFSWPPHPDCATSLVITLFRPFGCLTVAALTCLLPAHTSWPMCIGSKFSPASRRNLPECLLDLVLGVRRGPGPEASTSGGDALTSGGAALIFWPPCPSYPSAPFEAAHLYCC